LANTDQLTLVLGNESGDLDSMASAIGLAFVLTSATRAAIPVINIARADLALRPDCELLLRTALAGLGASTADLTFADDVDWARLGERGAAVWLADHNAPAARQSALEPLVRGIVDHHADEARCSRADPRQIDAVGSCATLVAERVRAAGAAHPALAVLLLAPILVDTANLDPAAGRATDRDRAQARWLEPQVAWAESGPDAPTGSETDAVTDSGTDALSDEPSLRVHSPAQLYRTLDRLKGQVAHLPPRDLLRKDYKQWAVGARAVGISSVSWRLRKWLKRDSRAQVEAAAQRWAAEQRLDVLLVMTHGKVREHKGADKTYGRDLAVAFAPHVDREWRRLVLDGLARADALDLRPFFGPESAAADGPVSFFAQRRIHASRKQVFPAVKAVIDAIAAH
ncbi:Exopolyphosphatase, partial [Coemansia sp. RSA 2706]